MFREQCALESIQVRVSAYKLLVPYERHDPAGLIDGYTGVSMRRKRVSKAEFTYLALYNAACFVLLHKFNNYLNIILSLQRYSLQQLTQSMSLFYLYSISAWLYSDLGKVLDIHTLLKLQVLDTVSHPELLALMVKIAVCCRLDSPLLLVFRQAHIL